MKKGMMILGIAALALALAAQAGAQIYGETSAIGWALNNWGRIRLYAPNTDGDRHIDRVNMVAAQSEQAVCDYTEDFENVNGPNVVDNPTLADVEHWIIVDNSYTSLPPDLTFRIIIYGWNGGSYCIVKYTIYNDEASTVNLYLGVLDVPGPEGGTYDATIMEYDASRKTAYAYLVGNDHPHAGLLLLSEEPYSFQSLDWDVYSPTDPSNDAAVDATRYHMTADTGFDAPYTTGPNGGVFNLNSGLFTLAPGDSLDQYFAIVYGNNLADYQTACAAAEAKYDAVFNTAVDQPEAGSIPKEFGLGQNYPNPFNPATVIPFDLKAASNVTMVVYDLRGNAVATLANGLYAAGSHRVEWNGRNDSGNVMPSGVYVCRLQAAGMTFSRKMMLVQ